MLPTWPALGALGITFVWAVVAFAVGYVVFLRRARTFAKEV
jgi:hypothetical protein